MHDNEQKRNHQIEEQLRSKITSKMTVSTFLAGFTFTVLNDLFQMNSLNIPQTIAAICMTGSLSLFVASVYMYAHMTTPKHYWSEQYSSPAHEHLYFYVKRTWKWVFTPAVILFILGFIATLFNTGNYLMIVVGVFIIAVVICYFYRMRPVL